MSRTQTLLLVDDDEGLRQSLAEQLIAEGFAIEQAGCAADGLAKAESGTFDGFLLDVGLPDMDGRDLCRQLRARQINAPIIMLTGVDTERDTIRGLDAGANDYVTKPFRMSLLMARLRAHLRQHLMTGDASVPLGTYIFHPAARLLVGKDDRKIRLTDKEVAILKYLHGAPDRTASRETLLAEVWGYNAAISTHTLETHIYRLRQKIEPDAAGAKLILTEPGGYRLAP